MPAPPALPNQNVAAGTSYGGVIPSGQSSLKGLSPLVTLRPATTNSKADLSFMQIKFNVSAQPSSNGLDVLQNH